MILPQTARTATRIKAAEYNLSNFAIFIAHIITITAKQITHTAPVSSSTPLHCVNNLSAGSSSSVTASGSVAAASHPRSRSTTAVTSYGSAATASPNSRSVQADSSSRSAAAACPSTGSAPSDSSSSCGAGGTEALPLLALLVTAVELNPHVHKSHGIMQAWHFFGWHCSIVRMFIPLYHAVKLRTSSFFWR